MASRKKLNITKIIKENKKFKNDELCINCNILKRSRMTLPCAHYCLCQNCVTMTSKCIYIDKTEGSHNRCNEPIQAIVNVYR